MANYFYQNPWEDAANIVSGLLQRQTAGNQRQMQAQAAVLGELLRAQQQEKQLGFEGQRTTAQVGADTARAGYDTERTTTEKASREGLARASAGMERGNMAEILASLPYAPNASTLMQGYSRGRGLEQSLPMAATNPMVALALALDAAQAAQPYSTAPNAVTDNPVTGVRSINPQGFNVPRDSLHFTPEGQQLQGVLAVPPGYEMHVPGGAGASNKPIVNPRPPTGVPPEEMRMRGLERALQIAMPWTGMKGNTNAPGDKASQMVEQYRKALEAGAPRVSPSVGGPQAQPIIFHNPATGEKIQLINGQWVPIP